MALRREIVESLQTPTAPPVAAPVMASRRPPLQLVDPLPQSDTSMDIQASGLFMQALASTTAGSLLKSPMQMASATNQLVGGVASATTAAVARALGRTVEGPLPTAGRDARSAHRNEHRIRALTANPRHNEAAPAAAAVPAPAPALARAAAMIGRDDHCRAPGRARIGLDRVP